jgi:hypothetical protein
LYAARVVERSLPTNNSSILLVEGMPAASVIRTCWQCIQCTRTQPKPQNLTGQWMGAVACIGMQPLGKVGVQGKLTPANVFLEPQAIGSCRLTAPVPREEWVALP